MKILSGLKKELILAMRGYYFYVEIFMAILILILFLFVIPENFNKRIDEYIYIDMPNEAKKIYLDGIKKYDLDNRVETAEVKIGGEKKTVELYETDNAKIHIMNSYEDMRYMAEKKSKPAGMIYLKDEKLAYKNFLQGYESDRYKNIVKVIHIETSDNLKAQIDSQIVKPQFENMKSLSDRDYYLPPILVFNGSLMGMFLIAAYIFIDKEENVIKAIAVTPDPVWHYLLTKVLLMTIISLFSSLVIILPIIGFKINYLLLTILLITTGLFSSAVGLLLASFYEDVRQAFGAVYMLIMLMIIPTISYMMPSWNPSFVKLIPSDAMLRGFKSILLCENNFSYILGMSGVYLMAAIIIFLISNFRYKKILA
ncbi:MAG: ABC transporter permease [Tissierellia bacterium]|nr:ABC transporter permease [Tissierellia bacterium]